MESGQLCLVNYGEVPPCWHSRLLLSQVQGSTWIILTPDMDRYPEQMDQHNGDFVDFEFLGHSANVPARINAAHVYSFRPMTPGDLAQQQQLGRIDADAERANLGLPPLHRGPAPPAAVAAAGVPPVAPPPPGLLGAAPPVPPVAAAAAGVGAVGGPAQPGVMVWVVIEDGGGRKKGDVVCIEPQALPVGHLCLGDRALIPNPNLPGQGCFVRRVPHADAANYQLDDLRVLPIRFDQQGTRRREFNDAVACMIDGVPQGGGLQLTGPTTGLNILKNLRDQNLTPTTFHEYWLRTSEIPRGDRSIYEHECLSRVLESMVTVDQLNICSLQGCELIARRMQVIREAHRISPSSPDYSAADHFMGWRWKRNAQGIDSSLSAHVASELKNEAAIAKEARKAREEQNARRQNPGKKGQGGGGEKS